MPCRGVHFALTAEESARLLSAAGDDALVDVMQEEIEERWDEEWLCETDKAWDAIHRCLSGGGLAPDGSTLSKVVLGGRQLHGGVDYVVSYLTPDEVRAVARALPTIDEPWMRSRFATLGQHGYDGPGDDVDFAYTWESFQALRAFYERAADAGRPVVFSVDQ